MAIDSIARGSSNNITPQKIDAGNSPQSGYVLSYNGTTGEFEWINVTGATYQGVWDANANNPSLASGVGTTGDYYIVSVAGTTTLDGISSWEIGDEIQIVVASETAGVTVTTDQLMAADRDWETI